MRNLQLIVVLITITAASQVRGQGPDCCTFEATETCGWSTTTWIKSTTALPNTAAYPGFIWGSTFSWIEDNSGTIETTQVFAVPDSSAVFTLDYYFNPLDLNAGNYLHVFLNVGTVPTRKVLLMSATAQVDGWLHMEAHCTDSSANFCCGSRGDVPCSGTIEVIAALPMSRGLIAIDNIGTCTASTSTTTPAVVTTTTPAVVTTTTPAAVTTTTPAAVTTTTPAAVTTTTPAVVTTTTPAAVTTTTPAVVTTTTPAVVTTTSIATTSTTPAPTTPTSATPTSTTPTATTTTAIATTTKSYPVQCCNFEKDKCIWSSTEWYWSQETVPDATIPPNPGNFMWTKTKGAAMESIMFTDILESSVFSLVYFVKGSLGGDSLMVTFQQDATSSSNVLATLTNTADQWLLVSFDCSPKPTLSSPGCCTTYPCQGKASITATYTSADCTFAVDDTSIDGDCGDALPCCYFDDKYVCNFINIPSPPDQWFWSVDSTPNTAVVPNFIPTSGYVWYQVVDVTVAQPSATFRSPLITINADAIITSSIFAYTDNTVNQNRLDIYFHNADNDVLTGLDYLISTSGEWATWTARCSSTHGECCSGQTTCTGYLEYTTTVVTGSAFYAIDAVSTPSPSGCSMPGLTELVFDHRHLNFYPARSRNVWRH